MKLKDYEMPQYGMDGGADAEDLKQYSLKNFDLKTYQLTQTAPDPPPMAAPYVPALPEPEPSTEQPNEPSFSAAPHPVETELNPPALAPYDVQFGAHFSLQTVSYSPLSPAEPWKLPRWVVASVGIFFGSAAVLTLAVCVALLRDPKPAPTAEVAVPPAAVATTITAPAPRPAAEVARAAAPPVVRHSAPPTTSAMRNDSAPARRVVVSRHPSVVRRQSYRSRRVASKSSSPSLASQETETASRRPPPDALDQLLGESSL